MNESFRCPDMKKILTDLTVFVPPRTLFTGICQDGIQVEFNNLRGYFTEHLLMKKGLLKGHYKAAPKALTLRLYLMGLHLS